MFETITEEQVKAIIEVLNETGHKLCDEHNVSCCIDQYPKHLNFQCKLESMPIYNCLLPQQ